MAAGGGLRFNPRTQEEPELTKAGFLVYSGSGHDYEWEFRAMAKFYATKADDRFSLGPKLPESLRVDAYIVAQDLGHDLLKATDAIEKIVEAVRKQIFPLQAQDAQELYRVGSSGGGVMSRQPGGSYRRGGELSKQRSLAWIQTPAPLPV